MNPVILVVPRQNIENGWRLLTERTSAMPLKNSCARLIISQYPGGGVEQTNIGRRTAPCSNFYEG